MKKMVWFDARSIASGDNDILSLVCNSEIDNLVVSAQYRPLYRLPRKTVFVVEVNDIKDLEAAAADDIVMSSDAGLLEKAAEKGNRTCIFLTVDDRESLEMSWRTGKKYDYVIIEFQAETNIPLELVIARLQNTGTSLLKKVQSAGEAEIAFGVMEQGSDGVFLSTTVFEEVVKVSEIYRKHAAGKMVLVPARVKSVEHIGMGYRACIDTTSLLKQNEGMIVGSTSRGGILVSSETHYLPYMNLRPFRVNAGAVHSYVWCPDDTTEYLTDLQSGSRVLAVDSAGNTREVSVGRVKIEMRPLLKIVADANGAEINTIVQDDWHIRLLGVNGEPHNASQLECGTVLAAYVCDAGRHVGIKIDETIIER